MTMFMCHCGLVHDNTAQGPCPYVVEFEPVDVSLAIVQQLENDLAACRDALTAENSRLRQRVEQLDHERRAAEQERDQLRVQLKTCKRAIGAALGTWCPYDPGGDGADGETYHLCVAALGSKLPK